MKIVVAPQAFKGTLTAQEVAKAIAKGAKRVFPHAVVVQVPIADGGDGTLDVVLKAKKGRKRYARVTSPTGRGRIRVAWGAIPKMGTAVIELAQVCGLERIPEKQRNPLKTTTYGLGELIRKALDGGYRNFLIGLGGSGTNDAGVGMAQALGIRFLSEREKEISLGGGALAQLAHIGCTAADLRLEECCFLVACDVTNPLTGSEGASLTYSPQKGASKAVASRLEKSMRHFARAVKKEMGDDLQATKGAGAAGGTAAAFLAFFPCKLCQGATVILDVIDFDQHLLDADIVITGEGCLDWQTLFLKGPLAVAKRAKQRRIPVIAIVGALGKNYSKVLSHGIDAVIPATFVGKSIASPKAIAEATEQALRCLKIGIAFGKLN